MCDVTLLIPPFVNSEGCTHEGLIFNEEPIINPGDLISENDKDICLG